MADERFLVTPQGRWIYKVQNIFWRQTNLPTQGRLFSICFAQGITVSLRTQMFSCFQWGGG